MPARHYYHKDIEVKRFALVHLRPEFSYLPDAGGTVIKRHFDRVDPWDYLQCG